MDNFENMNDKMESMELTLEELHIENEENKLLNNIVTLESTLKKFSKCGYGDIVVNSKQEAKLTIYTRQGTKSGIHFEKRCSNYRCRAGFFHGFHTYGKTKMFDENVLINTYLVGYYTPSTFFPSIF